METRSLRPNKTGLLLSCGRVITTVLHHKDANEKVWEKNRWKLHKNAMCCFWKKILESTTDETATYFQSYKQSK